MALCTPFIGAKTPLDGVWGLLAGDSERLAGNPQIGLGDDDAGGDGGGILDKIRRCLGVGCLSETVQLPCLLADAAAHDAGADFVPIKESGGIALGLSFEVDGVKADLFGFDLFEGFGVPCHVWRAFCL